MSPKPTSSRNAALSPISSRGLQDAANPEVVRHAAVDEVDERALLAVHEVLHLPEALKRAPGRPGAVLGVGNVSHPSRILVSAGAAVIVEGHRREHHRHRRRGGRRARQADRFKVGTEQVEIVLIERQSRSGGDIGARCDGDGTRSIEKIAKRCVLEQDLVVVFGRKLRAPGAAADELPPVKGRRGQSRPQYITELQYIEAGALGVNHAGR